MKGLKVKSLIVTFAVVFVYALIMNNNIASAAIHKCKGTNVYGPYAGWYANDTSHWVKCSCGKAMKKSNGTTVGKTLHNFKNGSCTTCGYECKNHNFKRNEGYGLGLWDMRCTKCKAFCYHNFKNGVCKDCRIKEAEHYCLKENSFFGMKNCNCGKVTHKCEGTDVYGPYAGWYANSDGHWVKCSCGKLMKSPNGTTAGLTSHNYKNGKCTTCGYKAPHKCKGTDVYGPYAGWYANSDGHWVKCSCGKAMKSSNGTVAGKTSHNFKNGSCTTCGYECKNHNFERNEIYGGGLWDMRCTKCKAFCYHNFKNGVCKDCRIKEVEHYCLKESSFTGKKNCNCGKVAHKCKGTDVYGPYAGWYANSDGHWVKCSCGKLMKSSNGTTAGLTLHNYKNGKCTTCGYEK